MALEWQQVESLMFRRGFRCRIFAAVSKTNPKRAVSPQKPAPDVLIALEAIASGRTADSVETAEIDFKEPVRRSRDDTIKRAAEAAICFANAAGGTIVIGVDDDVAGPDAFVGTDLEVDALRRRVYELTRPSLTVNAYDFEFASQRLLIVEVTEGLEIYTDTQGRATRRVHTVCEPLDADGITLLREERRGIDWSEQIASRSLDEVSATALDGARQRLARFPDSRREMARLPQEDLLRDLGVLSPGGELLRAGEVLFCDAVGDPAFVYQYRDTPGGEVVHDYRGHDPTLVAFERVMERIASRGNVVPIVLANGQQIELRDFPELAVREALVNALVHREYRIPAPVQVEHSPQIFTIVSPGPLVSGITEDNILTHPSRPRNKLLARVVHQLGLAEESGRGVDRMYREMIKAGKKPPIYEASALDTRVSLVGGAPNKRVARYVAQLPEAEQEDVDAMLVLFTLINQQRVDAPRMAPVLQRNVEATEAILRRLAEDGVGMITPSARTARRAFPKYYLRSEAKRALGPALAYTTRTYDEIESKMVQLVEIHGTIDSRTIQIAFDLDVDQAAYRLRDLVDRRILVKLGTQARGPGIKYGPGPKFPGKRPRRPSSR